MDEHLQHNTGLSRPRARSGLAVFVVFFAVFAFCAGVVVWLVTKPFRDVKTKSAQQVAADKAPAAPPQKPAEVMASVGGAGTGPGEFQDVRALAVDATGRVYAADFNRTGRIQVFDADARFSSEWRVSDSEPIQALAVGRDGQVLVVQAGEIARFDGTTGKRLSKVAYARGFHDVAALSDGSFVAHGWFSGRDRFVYLDGKGNVAREVSDRLKAELSEEMPEGHLAIDTTGRIWLLAGYTNPVILGVSSDGVVTNRIPSGKTRDQQFTGSASIAVDGAGRLLVTGRDAVQVWTTTGQFLLSIPVEGTPRDVAVVDAGTIWVSTSAQKLLKIRLAAGN